MNTQEQPSGNILINKLSGPTSFSAIYNLRKITGIKKIGHAGTLDPFANGLLIIAIGKTATKKISQFVKLDKEYIATVLLGATSSTGDPEGEILNTETKPNISETDIKTCLKSFLGKQKQTAPMHSAKQVKGKRLYEFARKGIEIEREPCDIEIYEIELLEYSWPICKIRCRVSSGTYIRTLAEDIGKKLGTGAYLKELSRTAISKYSINDAYLLSELTPENWAECLFN